MEVWFWAVITVISWGVWLTPLEWVGRVDSRFKTLMITIGNAAVALAVAVSVGLTGLSSSSMLAAILGGVVWSLSGYFAVIATDRLGIAVAMGVWAPLNILTSLAWGGLFFSELDSYSITDICLVLLAFLVISLGIVLIVRGSDIRPTYKRRFSLRDYFSHSSSSNTQTYGWLAVILAGVGWGSYFVPLRFADASLWVMSWPLSVGMLLGASLLWLGGLPWQSGRFRKQTISPSDSKSLSAVLAATVLAGVLWAAGNYGSLNLMTHLGTGQGFAVAQTCLVVNALLGMIVFSRPPWPSPSAFLVLAGVIATSAGTAMMGWLGSQV
ncbi:GRP family sugar transporter [Mucisphaera sp.]|uniref:GRP family sugar transporter n=1 Tax=Mucisphaera sp. TaxID=2913024 RepID=UPI003D12FA2B